MTPEDIGNLTIAQVEAIVARASDALTKFQEAKRLLGAPMASVAAAVTAPPPNNNFTPAELAERTKLLQQMRNAALPPDIRAMEEQ